MQLESMYQEIILDHYRTPHGRGLREPFEAEVHHVNPTCGDEVTLRVHLNGDTIADVSYEGMGCSISQASVSAMYDLVVGRTVPQALETGEHFMTLMQAKAEARSAEKPEDELEDAVAFAGVSKYPARIKCALMSWMALKDASARALSVAHPTAPTGGQHEGDHREPEHRRDPRRAARLQVGAARGRRGGHARRRRPRARCQRRRPGARLRHRRRRVERGDPRHDPDVRCVPADRRHRGPGPPGPDRRPRSGPGRRHPDQLGLDAAVGPRQDHRRRPRAAARTRLPRLTLGHLLERLAAGDDPAWVCSALAHDPIAAPLGARFLAALADRVGAEPGSLDAVCGEVLFAPGGSPPARDHEARKATPRCPPACHFPKFMIVADGFSAAS